MQPRRDREDHFVVSLTVNEPVRTVEMILQVLPQTTNVVVVIGDSALERFWSTEIQRELQPFSNRVSFAWLNQMPFSEMLKRCAVLPPRSAIGPLGSTRTDIDLRGHFRLPFPPMARKPSSYPPAKTGQAAALRDEALPGVRPTE